jgi:hypothetical protein
VCAHHSLDFVTHKVCLTVLHQLTRSLHRTASGGSDGGTWGSSIYSTTFGGTLDTAYPSEDGYLVGRGWEYERVEAPYVYMDGEMYWNEGKTGSGNDGSVGVEGHGVAHRMLLHHMTSSSLVHGYSVLDGPQRPPNQLSNESIDVWMRAYRLACDCL